MRYHFNSELKHFDEELGGFETGKVYFVNSSLSIEASSLLFISAIEFAEKQNVSYFSFDRKADDIITEMMACKSNIKCKLVRKPTNEVFETLRTTLCFLQRLPIFFIDDNIISQKMFFERIIQETEGTGSNIIIIDRLDYTDFYMDLSDTEKELFFQQLVEFARVYDVCIIVSISDSYNYSDSYTHKIFLKRSNLDTVTSVLTYIDNKPSTPLQFDSSCMKLSKYNGDSK